MDNRNKKLMPTVLYPDKYVYYKKHLYKNKKGNLITYLRCGNKLCSATAQLVDGQFKSMKEHNHEKPNNFAEIAQFRQKLFKAVNRDVGTPKTVYNSVAIRNPTKAANIPYKKIRRTLHNWRLKKPVKNPKSLKECEKIMNGEKWKQLLKFNLNSKLHKINVFQFEHGKENVSVVLADKQFIKKFECCTIFSIDATFDTTPIIDNVYQLLTIMAKYNEKFVPIIWVLMSNKFERSYIQIFQFIREKIMTRLEPLLCICDFETGLHNAIKTVFQGCLITGCLFHFLQSLKKKAKKNNIFSKPNANIEEMTKAIVLFRKICNLAYLPANNIEEEFVEIVKRTMAERKLFENYYNFFNYFKNYWLKQIGVQKGITKL
ncbi:uncharacterized protein [Prorops nasuta]|uniref:uncharacterized protein n=2 Tax=Prorops nasuta TaxID=863751 RepID=UPI0034CFC89F